MFSATGLIIISATVFIYGSICILCLILTFSRTKYLEIEAIVAKRIFPGRIIIPVFSVNINWFNDWLVFHNKITGPILIMLSIIDLKLFFLVYQQTLTDSFKFWRGAGAVERACLENM